MKDKKINGWKLTAIISLIINGLVSLLLIIGLTGVKPTTKVSALDDSTEFYIYENSYNIDPQDFNRSKFNFSGFSTYTDGGYWHASANFNDNVGYPYLMGGRNTYISLVDFVFKPSYSYLEPSDGYLCRIVIYPLVDTGQWRNVFSATWNDGFTNLNVSYYSLGYNSEFALFPSTLRSNLLSNLDFVFSNLGTTTISDSYSILDNWNPNKYLSISSGSLGYLYDSPQAYRNSDSNVKWFNPIYQPSVDNVQSVSSLGYLEIPLLFESNGDRFVGIRLYYDVVQYYKVDSNTPYEVISYGNNVELHLYHYTFAYMSYCYQLSDTNSLGVPLVSWSEIVVCATPVYQILHDFTSNGTNYRAYVYYQNQPIKWLNNSYKTISVYNASSEQLNKIGISEDISRSRFAINGLTIKEILNYDMAQETIYVNGNNNIGNVFVLIKNGFESFLPILAISVLPGVTIGMLVFLPLVLTIIIVVIKLVKR